MRWLPRTLYGRLVLLMALGLVVAQLAGAAIQLYERQRSLGHSVSHELAQRLAAVYRAIDGQAPGNRQPLATLLATPHQRLTLMASAPPSVDSPTMLADFPGHLAELLGPGVAMRIVELPRLGAFNFDLYLQLASGDWLRVHGGAPQEIFALPWHLLLNLGLMLLAVLGLVLVAARSTVKPLTDLARAAHNLSNDLKSPPLTETGPSEVREAAQAFNTMQSRIRSGIEERERFLAAISHDLKTPVTRLRLRTEMLADAELRERFRTDVDDMQDLLDGALDFLRGQSVHEAVQPIDLVALLESLVDDYADHASVTLQAPEALRFAGRPKALKRALVNLIENALKYGGRADITLARSAQGVDIVVQDNGPGLPQEELEKVFEPFYRVESSRSRDTGGSGLGLAIVRQIARSHGGDISLSNRPEGGLRADLRLTSAGYSDIKRVK